MLFVANPIFHRIIHIMHKTFINFYPQNLKNFPSFKALLVLFIQFLVNSLFPVQINCLNRTLKRVLVPEYHGVPVTYTTLSYKIFMCPILKAFVVGPSSLLQSTLLFLSPFPHRTSRQKHQTSLPRSPPPGSSEYHHDNLHLLSPSLTTFSLSLLFFTFTFFFTSSSSSNSTSISPIKVSASGRGEGGEVADY